MKYDEQVFNLSIDAYNMVESSKVDSNEEVKKKQDKLLKMLLTKFQEELKSKENIGDGILRVKFKSQFWSDFNDGYREIDELVKSNDFDSFASDYCMYIGNREYRCDEYYSTYYEIIWDYKTYFEQLKAHHPAKKVINEKKKQERQAKKEYCKINGHDFENWKEQRWTTEEEYGSSGIESLFTGVGTIKVEHINWTRRCKNCGSVQSTSKKPAEIEATEIEEQIKTLQRKLGQIKK